MQLVYFDVTISGQAVGRIEMVLFTDVSPRAAENFRQLCTGESGVVPAEPGREGGGVKRHFKGAPFYRIIDQFIDQAGVNTESVFGGQVGGDFGARGILLMGVEGTVGCVDALALPGSCRPKLSIDWPDAMALRCRPSVLPPLHRTVQGRPGGPEAQA